MQATNDIEIVDYASRYGNAFERLNCEWLETFFRVEPIDRIVLSDPQNSVLKPGGAILYAVDGSTVLGTVALMYHGGGEYELTKMAVTKGFQGKGLGRRLLSAALARFEALGGERLYLESHTSLAPALALYESAGFRHEPRPRPSEYQRSDVYMVYRR